MELFDQSIQSRKQLRILGEVVVVDRQAVGESAGERFIGLSALADPGKDHVIVRALLEQTKDEVELAGHPSSSVTGTPSALARRWSTASEGFFLWPASMAAR